MKSTSKIIWCVEYMDFIIKWFGRTAVTYCHNMTENINKCLVKANLAFAIINVPEYRKLFNIIQFI